MSNFRDKSNDVPNQTAEGLLLLLLGTSKHARALQRGEKFPSRMCIKGSSDLLRCFETCKCWILLAPN